MSCRFAIVVPPPLHSLLSYYKSTCFSTAPHTPPSPHVLRPEASTPCTRPSFKHFDNKTAIFTCITCRSFTPHWPHVIDAITRMCAQTKSIASRFSPYALLHRIAKKRKEGRIIITIFLVRPTPFRYHAYQVYSTPFRCRRNPQMRAF